MTHPAQVLDFQAFVLDKMSSNTPEFQTAYNTLLSYLTNAGQFPIEDNDRIHTMMNLRRLTDHLKIASAYHVDADSSDLIQTAAPSLTDEDVLRMDFLPSENGFAYFDAPLTFTTKQGNTEKVNALAWLPSTGKRDLNPTYAAPGISPKPGLILHMWNDRQQSPDNFLWGIKDKAAQGLPEAIKALDLLEASGRFLYVGAFVLEADTTTEETLRNEGIAVTDLQIEILKKFISFYLLMQQPVIDVSDADINRKSARRARRAKIPDRVSVIRLRPRKRPEQVGEATVEWSHRWWSRGHWGWRNCSEHHPLAEPNPKGGWRCRVYVSGSIKGPADKPLVVTKKVYVM